MNLSSDAGLVGTVETAIYNASKGGVSLLTKSLALELAPKGVRVNAVCPNDVDTPMLAGQARDYGGDDPEGYLASLLANYPQKDRARFIRPEEIAALIVYLASDEAAPITGACIPIDFGSTAGYYAVTHRSLKHHGFSHSSLRRARHSTDRVASIWRSNPSRRRLCALEDVLRLVFLDQIHRPHGSLGKEIERSVTFGSRGSRVPRPPSPDGGPSTALRACGTTEGIRTSAAPPDPCTGRPARPSRIPWRAEGRAHHRSPAT